MEEHWTELSPCGRFELVIDLYGTPGNPTSPCVGVSTVKWVATGEIILTTKHNDAQCTHAWVSRSGVDYLLFPECLEGQSVMDLTNRRVAGFFSKEETFIWCVITLSPDEDKIAIEGCYWACPYEVTIYDFRDPMTLPLPILTQITFSVRDGAWESFGAWLDDRRFTIVGQDGMACIHELP